MNVDHQNGLDHGHDGRSWIQVAETMGDSETQMFLENLRAEGIQATAIESHSIALITGRHSIARVLVPEEDVGAALLLLDPIPIEDEEDDKSDPADLTPELDDLLPGAPAPAVRPVGTGIAYAQRVMNGSEDEKKEISQPLDCPNCGVALELSDSEMIERSFTCPDCRKVIWLDKYVACPWCETELELEVDEVSQGWFICPECRRAARL